MGKKRAVQAKATPKAKAEPNIRSVGEAAEGQGESVETPASGGDLSLCNFQDPGQVSEAHPGHVVHHGGPGAEAARHASTAWSESLAEYHATDAGELEHLLEDWFEAPDSTQDDAVSLERILGGDDRVEVSTPGSYPFSCICYLLIETKLGRLMAGTGWLISSRLLVTAGHCVYRRDEQDYVKSIRVFRGGSDRNGFVQTSQRFFVCGSYPTCAYDQMTDFDYGAVVLDEPFPDTGTLGVGVYPNQDLENNTFSLVGFPVDKPQRSMWHHARPLTCIKARTLEYQIDTFPGMSGGPILDLVTESGTTRYISLAIHSGSLHNRPLNRACRIVEQVWENLQRWLAVVEKG
jgi:glutamyl endopeptidase